uniref:Uncharacterized protein n=1 Tax=Leersia perrieri TaxID=77586 RepID=A0A0D9X9Z9_9ORYZ
MESAVHKSGGGGGEGGSGGGNHHLVCHACGYQYPNAHPSAKQRRAHRKNCGNNPPSSPAAAVAGVEEEKLLRDGGGGGGEGDGASAADSGGVLLGSAEKVGNVADDDGNAERSSPQVNVVQIVHSKCTEDCVVSGELNPSGNDSKASGTENNEIQNEAVTRLPENLPHFDDKHPSESAISSDQCQDGTSLLVPEQKDGETLNFEFSADEISKSNVVSLETVAALSKDGIGNNEDDFSFLERPKTVEEDTSVEDSDVVSKEQIPCEETVSSMEQSSVMFTNSMDDVSNSAKEPINLLGDKVSCVEKHVCLDEASSNDLSQLASGASHSDAPDTDKPQHQDDCATQTPDQLIIPKEMDTDGGLQFPDADVNIKALSGAVGHADEDKTAVNFSKNVCAPHSTVEGDIQDSVRQTSDMTLMPPQVDLSEVSTSSTSHDIDKITNEEGIDERSPDVNLTSHEVNEVHGIDVEEIPQNEDNTAYNDPQECNTVCATCDFEENIQNEEIIAEVSPHKITTVQGTCNVEEKEQIEEFDGSRDIEETRQSDAHVETSDKINVPIEETKQSDAHVETSDKINVLSSLENVEEEQKYKEITADPSLEINVQLSKVDVETTTDRTAYEVNTVNITENVEEKKQNEEITMDPTSNINMICSTATDEKKQNDEISVGPSSDETIVPHDKYNVEENNEETVLVSKPNKINVVGTTDSVEDKNQNGEVTFETTSHEDSAICIHTIDNVEEKKGDELSPDSTSHQLDMESSADNVEEKRQTEDITTDPSSHESDTLNIIDGAEIKKQDTEVAADPAAGKFDVPQSTDDAEERKETVSTHDLKVHNRTENKEQDAEFAVKPASDKTDDPQSVDDTEQTKQKEETVSTDDPKVDDQNEEIADKEVIVDSDKNHISLKSLLTEKAAETKEKKPSTKDRVLSFRRRVSKDGASPVKPGSPKAAAVSGQQDWNSPARLPAEKKPKAKKQQWVPFICCHSMN